MIDPRTDKPFSHLGDTAGLKEGERLSLHKAITYTTKRILLAINQKQGRPIELSNTIGKGPQITHNRDDASVWVSCWIRVSPSDVNRACVDRLVR